MSRKSDTEESRERNRQYQRKWYKANKEVQHARVRKNRIEQRIRAKDFLDGLRSKGCSRCSENDLACLDFHHLNGESKELTLSKAANKGYGIERLKKEVSKCIILCSNCHRKEHRDRRRGGSSQHSYKV